MKKFLIFCVVLTLFINSNHAQISSTSFAAKVDFSTGTGTLNPARLAAADLNADGLIDVMVPNNGNSTVAVFRNVSASTGWYTSSFVTQSNISVNSNVQSVVLADLDGDGKPDLITTHGNLGTGGGGSNNIYVYQNGSSTGAAIAFYTGSAFAAGVNPVSVVPGDIDGDGKLDLVVASFGNGVTNNGTLVVLRNTSTGVGVFTFVAGTAYTTNINSPYNVKIADFDADGKKDIVVANYLSAGYISVYKNNSTTGSITLNAVNTYTAGTNPEYLDVGDIDGDGKIDIACTNYGSANVSIFRNTTTSSGISFAAAVNFGTGTNPAGVNLTDFDGDGKLDGVVLNRTSGTIGVSKNTATPGTINSSSFASSVNFATNNSPTGVITGDLDGDGKSEIIISNQGAGNISVYRNQIIAAKPTTASSNLSFSGLTSSSVTLSWTKGNGAKRIILAHANTAVSSNPTDSFSFAANTTFGSGAQIGSGNYVVYNDTGSTVTVTGLTTGTNYYFVVYEYNGNAAYSSYLTSPVLSGNLIISSNVYYSKSSGALNSLSTWGTNTDGSGTAPASFTTASTFYFVQNNSAPTITGDWTVTGSGSMITFGDGTNAFNLIIPTAYALTADTISVKSNITITIQGQLYVNKSYYDASTTAQYIGSSATQFISPGSYYNLVLTGSYKVLSGNVTARNLLNMSSNISNPSYTFTLGSRATSTGTLTRTGGIIMGSFTRWFGTVTTSGATGLFPIGTSSFYRPIEVDYTTAPTVGGTLTASFIASNPGSTGLPLFDFTISASMFIDQQGVDGYWSLTNSGITGGTNTVIANAAGFTSVWSYADLRMLRRANSSSAWTIPGTATVGTGSNASPTISRTGLTTNGGDFGVGSDHTLNGLPVKLIILTVRQNMSNALLNWETASEMNSAHFVILKSLENKKWQNAGQVIAAGNSNDARSYIFNDPINKEINAGVKTIYYRLEQVDKDGSIVSSNVIALDLKQKLNTITLFPLPVKTILNAVSSTGETVSEITIYDMSGKQLVTARAGEINAADLAHGIYIAKVVTDKETYFQKISK